MNTTLRHSRCSELALAVLACVALALPLQAQFRGGDRGSDRGSGGGASSALQASTQVTVVADEYSNSLIILAPEPYQAAIKELVDKLDVAVSEITELRVFRLLNADPNEMAQVLNNLFSDNNSSNNNNNRDRGPGFFFGRRDRGGDNNNSDDSDRAKKQSRVLAVADARTSSIIVSASHDLMEQIAPMISQLDADTAKKQKVYVYSLENADVQEVETILRNLFETQNTRNSRTSQNSQQNNALTQRANNAARNQGSTTTGSGLGGFGNNGGGLSGNGIGR